MPASSVKRVVLRARAVPLAPGAMSTWQGAAERRPAVARWPAVVAKRPRAVARWPALAAKRPQAVAKELATRLLVLETDARRPVPAGC
jgi:hypothetical protein